MILIRSEREVYNQVENPAVVYDRNLCMMIKIGEREDMLAYQHRVVQAYIANGFDSMVSDVGFMALPKDQEIVDKVFNCSGYLKTLITQMGGNGEG